MFHVFLDRKYRLLRKWSNKEIRKLGVLFYGDIVNVSGWEDKDKFGDYYKNYFPNASSYTITNFSTERGYAGKEGEIFLDLSKELDRGFSNKFDLVFNHTTLEHIYNFQMAFSNLCKMSRDAVLIVVPFSQPEHSLNTFKDYWRFTPDALRTMFAENGFTVAYESVSPYRNASIYLLFVGVRNTAKWKNKFYYKKKERVGETIGRWF